MTDSSTGEILVRKRVMHQPPPVIEVVSAPVHCVDFAQTLAIIAEEIASRHGLRARQDEPTSTTSCFQICTVNPEFVVDAWRTPGFANVLRQADLCVPDGVGILVAARLQNRRLRERVTGSDGIYHICRHAAQAGWRIFFLGAAPGVAKRTARQLQLVYPGLQVAGTYTGSPAEAEWPHIRARLQQTQPDILFVAYGHPAQDFWIHQHREELSTAVAIGVGGAFDFVAGTATRAPRWLRRLGLEWLYRLIRQPWRWRRMSKLPIFIALVFISMFRHPPSTSDAK